MTDKWFDDKFEKNNLRKYTSRRLNENKSFNKLFRKFSITNWLIIINIAVYLLIVILRISGFSEERLFNIFALQATALFNGAYWTILTSMFTHIWLPHLFFNMISLFFVGSFLEKLIGRKKFLTFYLLSGLFAGIFAGVLSFYFGNSDLGARIFINPNIYSVGASGAIFGIAGLLAMLTPKMRVYLIAGPIVALILQSTLHAIIPENPILGIIDLAVMIYIFMAIFTMFSFNPKTRKLAMPLAMPFWVLPIVAIVPLMIIGLFVELPIGNTAHLGGLIAGLAYGNYLRNKYKRKSAMISKRFS